MSSLTADEVRVWQVDLGAALAPSEERLLSADERARAARLVFPDDRRRFAVAHAALRVVLGSLLQQAPERLAFAAAPRGKLSLAGASEAWLRFNLSHSRDVALIACAREREVGVDIEWMREDIECGDIVARFFSPAERAEWAALPPARQREAFFHGWTRKEAYAKALGEGLSHAPDGYTVRLAPAGPAALLEDTLRPGAAGSWSLQALPAPAGYVAAIAVAGSGWRLSAHPFARPSSPGSGNLP